MTISRVTIKGFHNVENKTYELRNLNYLFGRNGAGKSTVLQAIQLALLGYIPGTNKTNVAIFTHANGPLISIKLDFADSEIKSITRNFVKSGKSVVTSVDVIPNKFTAKDIEQMLSSIELPIFNFNDFIGMTANTMKDWFINFLPKSKMDINWHAVLGGAIENLSIPEDVKSKLVATHSTACEAYGTDSIESIRQANAYFKSTQSIKKAEYQRVVDTVQSLVYYDDVEQYDNPSEIDAKITKLQSDKNDYLKLSKEYDYAVASLETFKSELEKFSDLGDSFERDPKYVAGVDEIKSLDADYKAYVDTINDCKHKQAECNSKIAQVKSDIQAKQSVIFSNGICPYTNKTCNDITTLVNAYIDEVAKLDSTISDYEKELSEYDKQIAWVNEHIVSIEAKRTELNSKLLEIKLNYNHRDMLLDAISKVEVPEVPETTIDYDVEIYALYDIKTKLSANDKYNKLIKQFTADKFNLEYELEALKAWISVTGVNGMQVGTDSGSAFTPLAVQMNPVLKTLMGKDTEVYFNEVGKANSFSFGIMRTNGYIEYDLLSSGEKCLFALALLIGIVNISSTPLKLLMIDDAFDHLDSDNVENTFNILSNIKDVQMVFAGVKEVHTDNAKDFVINIG